jgi:L-Lysine epsilon oxidase N-terminal/L-lysine epsilon oxidase C-terminal domain
MASNSESTIVRAAIHPGIGIARIGNSKTEYFIGPEVPEPPRQPAEFYRDGDGAIKRQAARFRIYGYNAAGEVVGEVTPESKGIDITWTVHVANRKPQWYRFLSALDIPEAVSEICIRRNKNYPKREELAIDPGPRSISGVNISGGAGHAFDTGTFKAKTTVPLGEIRTDEAGRLLVLGGTGYSASPSNAPVFDPSDPDSFNNANDWFDDTSDGPVTAAVSVNGKPIPVESAWVVVAPPNYAPDAVSWRTMYDEMRDVSIEAGIVPMPAMVSFKDDVLPILQRQSNLQWVNAGYAAMFGKGRPWDFNDPALIAKLAQAPETAKHLDPYRELRLSIYNNFRPELPAVAEPPNYPHVWPWIYGDAFGSFPENGPGNMLPMTPLQSGILKRWADGNFTPDWPPKAPPPAKIEQVPLQQQPATLDKAALDFCLSDTFHPGCEMTWPMRHASIYEKPFRIRQRPAGEPEPDYGPELTQKIALQTGGPLYAQSPGDLTRWMALPWQGDTAFCRSGYNPEFDPYLPTFWAARVPNQVLNEDDYKIAIDPEKPREERLAAFNRRSNWEAPIDVPGPDHVAASMMKMIADFGKQGIVGPKPGAKNDPDIPETIYVETIAHPATKAVALQVSAAKRGRKLSAVERAGWASQEQFEAFRAVRVRPRRR